MSDTKTADTKTAVDAGRRPTHKPAVAAVVALGALLAVGMLLFTGTMGDRDGVTVIRKQRAATPSASSTATVPTGGAFPYQPIWPFGSAADAAAWQVARRSNLTDAPWHLNPGVTALSFTRGFLGYNDLNKVFHFQVKGTQAWVGVGYAGAQSPAGVVHLARFGTGSDAPWEVVGTTDSTLSIASPSYGATVSSPLAVRGRITGANETMRVQVRSLRTAVLGQSSNLSASGSAAPWSAQVSYTAQAKTVLIIAVASGGHVRQVERFAVTAVVATASTQPVSDVDGDGKADTVRLVRPDSVRVDYGNGLVDVVAFTVSNGFNPGLLGAQDTDGDRADEVFVRAGPGITALFRYSSGRLRLVTLAGQQAQLRFGGTTTMRASWACGAANTPITIWSGTPAGGGAFSGLARHYRFDGSALSQTTSGRYSGTAPPAGCGRIKQA